MKPEAVLELLEKTADQLGIRVSYETLATSVVHGGLCKVKGQYRIIVDKRASAEERVAMLASSISTFDLTHLDLTAKLRGIIRQYEGAPAPKRKAA